MANLVGREAFDELATRRLSRLSARHRREAAEYMGYPPDVSKIPPEFWEQIEREWQNELATILVLIWMASAEQHGMGLDQADLRGPIWANGRSQWSAGLYSRNTRRGLNRLADRWGKMNGQLTKGLVQTDLERVIGRRRSDTIATTEITRAINAAIQTVGDLESRAAARRGYLLVWQLGDAMHCATCPTLAGTDESFWGRWTDGPPIHPNCACWLNLIPIGTELPPPPDADIVDAAIMDSGIFESEVAFNRWLLAETCKPLDGRRIDLGVYGKSLVAESGKILTGPAKGKLVGQLVQRVPDRAPQTAAPPQKVQVTPQKPQVIPDRARIPAQEKQSQPETKRDFAGLKIREVRNRDAWNRHLATLYKRRLRQFCQRNRLRFEMAYDDEWGFFKLGSQQTVLAAKLVAITDVAERIRTGARQGNLEAAVESLAGQCTHPFGADAYDKAVCAVVDSWSDGSGSPLSSALQAAAREQLDIQGPKFGLREDAEQLLQQCGPALELVAKAIHDHTQQSLTDANVEGLMVYRGLRYKTLPEQVAQWPASQRHVALPNVKVVDDPEIVQRPLSSWCVSAAEATVQAGANGVVIGAWVPRERIFSTPQTGLGNFNAHEVVIVGHKLSDCRALVLGGGHESADKVQHRFWESQSRRMAEHLPGEHDQSSHGNREGIPIDPDSLSKEVLSKMSRNLKKQGYDIRGAADVRKLLQTGHMLKDGKLWHEDWVAAYQFATGSAEKRVANKQAKDEQRAKYANINWDRIRQLGITHNPDEAGYLTPTGSMVDLSGRLDGAGGGSRQLDHREAGGTEGMLELMASGYIRWMPEAGGFDISVAPTPSQERLIAKLDRVAEHLPGEHDQADHGNRDSSETLKAWFKDSKIVNSNGEPRIVYTGQPAGLSEIPQAERSEFPVGHAFFTTSKRVAAQYAGTDADEVAGKANYSLGRRGEVYAAYLSIQRPFDCDQFDEDEWAKFLLPDVDIESDGYTNLDLAQSLGLNPVREYDEAKDKQVIVGYQTPLGSHLPRDFALDDAAAVLWGERSGQGDTLEFAIRDRPSAQLLVMFPDAGKRYISRHQFDGLMFTDAEMGGTTIVPFQPNQIKIRRAESHTAESARPVAEADAPGERWITLKNGTHVRIDAKGMVTAGYGRGKHIKDVGDPDDQAKDDDDVDIVVDGEVTMSTKRAEASKLWREQHAELGDEGIKGVSMHRKGEYKAPPKPPKEEPAKPGAVQDVDPERRAKRQEIIAKPKREYAKWKFEDGLGWNELVAKYGEDAVMQERQAARVKELEWETAMLTALSLGEVTQEEAKEKGAMITGGEKYVPLPEELYHVTTAADAVVKEGLKTREELGQGHSGKGLGGGPNDTISFTDSTKIAAGIKRAMLEAQAVAAGKISPQELVAAAKEGRGAKEPWLHEIYKQYNSGWDPSKGVPYDLQDALNGTKTSMGHFGEPPKEEPGQWEPHPNDEGWKGGDGRMRYSFWRRKATPEEQQHIRFQLYKYFSYWREIKGGPLDPLFFSSDVEGLAKVDPAQIQIVKVKSKEGAQGYQVAALGEWRTHTGEAVTVDSVLDYNPTLDLREKIAAEYAYLIPAEYRVYEEWVENLHPRDEKGRFADKADAGYAPPTIKTPQFRKWFGDSKVVNAQGQPQRVFHGGSGDFNEFDVNKGTFILDQMLGPHFAVDDDIADTFTVDDRDNTKIPVGANVKPVYLSIEKPREIDQTSGMRNGMLRSDQHAIARDVLNVAMPESKDVFVRWISRRLNLEESQGAEIFDRLQRGESIPKGEFGLAHHDATDPDWAGMSQVAAFVDNYDHGLIMLDEPDRREIVDRYKQILKSQGYDGIRYTNTAPGEIGHAEDKTCWIAFEPEQIKSASGNKGEFRKDRGDIRESAPRGSTRAKKC